MLPESSTSEMNITGTMFSKPTQRYFIKPGTEFHQAQEWKVSMANLSKYLNDSCGCYCIEQRSLCWVLVLQLLNEGGVVESGDIHSSETENKAIKLERAAGAKGQ